MDTLNSYQRARILLFSASVLCFLLFWMLGSLFHIPAQRHFEASVLQQPSPVLVFLLIAVALAVSAALGTLLAGRIRFNAGLVASCLGLMALSFRGGSSREAIRWALAQGNMPGIFLRMAIETAVLGLLIAGVWFVLKNLYHGGTLRDREGDPASHHTPELQSNLLSSLAIQILATFVLVMLLAQAEAKNQVLAAIFIASWGGSVIAHQLFPTATSATYFLPPLIVGVVGYLLAWFNPDGASIASLSGTFAALARPLPLDYASAGTAAAIMGHWMSRRWQRQKQEEAAAVST